MYTGCENYTDDSQVKSLCTLIITILQEENLGKHQTRWTAHKDWRCCVCERASRMERAHALHKVLLSL
jgi:hypothetical protein